MTNEKETSFGIESSEHDNLVHTQGTVYRPPTPPHVTMSVSHEEKPESCNGVNFKRWQQLISFHWQHFDCIDSWLRVLQIVLKMRLTKWDSLLWKPGIILISFSRIISSIEWRTLYIMLIFLWRRPKNSRILRIKNIGLETLAWRSS